MVGQTLTAVRRLAAPFVAGVRRHGYAWAAAAVAVGLVAYQAWWWGLALARWDWLLLTGVATLLLGLPASRRLPDRVDTAVDRLTNRGALRPDAGDALRARLHGTARRFGLVGAGCAPLVLFLLWPAGVVTVDVLLVLEMLAAVPVGRFIGSTVAYGMLGRHLRGERAAARVVLEPGHPDGAAGLRPLGELYFFQAKLLAWIGGFVGIWWLVFPLLGGRYARWREPYLQLFGVVVACELLAFLIPLWWVHQAMADGRRELLRAADRELTPTIVALHREILGAPDPEQLAFRRDRLAALKDRYSAVDRMPTWPVDVRIRRRFALNNAALLIPVVTNVVGASKPWQTIADALQRWLSG
ncbi:MAG TPA: hypothetical protein VGP02_17685 [Mycobacteriales bacterium]|jgi:hypothetical protein|nr:hypothetical protein [Mycobacteriales bacterium]